jgi:hypothetical protein
MGRLSSVPYTTRLKPRDQVATSIKYFSTRFDERRTAAYRAHFCQGRHGKPTELFRSVGV